MSQGITYHDVANAAIALLEQKQHPTLDRIREFLGTGSKSTIARHFRAWKSKNEENSQEDIPHELLTPLKELWNQVIAKGDQRIEKVELDTQQEIEQLRQQLNLAEKNYIELQSAHHHLEEKFHDQVRETNQWQQAYDAEKLAHEKLKVSHDTLNQQRDEQKNEMARLHQLLNHVQANLEHYQTAMQKLREERMLEAEKQKITYERDIAESKQEIARLLASANRLQRERDQLTTQLDHLTQQYNMIATEKTSLVQQLQEKIIAETTLQIRYDDLQQLSSQHKALIEKHSTSIVTHEKNIAVLSDQIERLQQSLQAAEDKIEVLRDEKLFLTQEKAQLEGLLKQRDFSSSKQ